jgi:hypothetical protein
MKPIYLLIGCLCLCAFAILPAQAFTIKTLTITLGQNGDAQVGLQYQLSLPEQIGVFFHLANPSAELQSALDQNLNRQVTVERADSSSADITIPSFATVSGGPGTLIMTTPAFSLAHAQAVMEQYWFAPLLSPDFTPQVTTITFPDGYSDTLYSQISIPSVMHVLAS